MLSRASKRAPVPFALLMIVLGLALTCPGCHALILAIDDGCANRPRPRCGPSVVIVPRRHCR